MGALDSSLLEKINVVENARSEKLIHEEFTPRTIDKSKKLYSILTSFTKGRPLRTIKQVQDENGFEAWRLLLEEHLPHTRARSLQLLSNLIHTKFDSKRTTMENILKFEDSIEEYEKSSGDTVQDDLKVSVVLGNTEGPLRQHLLLNVKETTKYSTPRQFLVSYEQTTRWTTTDLIHSGKDHGGQADMDISRVKGEEKGGKGEGKGKMSWKGKFGGGKGKKGRGKGKGYGNHFYKGKGRGCYNGGKKEKVEEEEEVTKEDSRAKAEDSEVERPMLVYVIIAIGLVTTKPIADRSKETCKAATSGKHIKMISRVLHPPVLQQHCIHQPLLELRVFPLSSCHTSQIPQLDRYPCTILESSQKLFQNSLS